MGLEVVGVGEPPLASVHIDGSSEVLLTWRPSPGRNSKDTLGRKGPGNTRRSPLGITEFGAEMGKPRGKVGFARLRASSIDPHSTLSSGQDIERATFLKGVSKKTNSRLCLDTTRILSDYRSF